MSERLLYSRQQTAEQLSLSLSTVDMLIGRGILRVRRMGKRVLVPAEEIARCSRREMAALWPAKQNGKTVRGYRYGAPRRAVRMQEIDLAIEASAR